MKKLLIALTAIACFAGGGKLIPITGGAGEPGSFVPKAGGNGGFKVEEIYDRVWLMRYHDMSLAVDGSTNMARIQWTTNFFELWKEPTGVVFVTCPAIVEWRHAGTMNRCAIVIYNGQTNILKGELLETVTNTFEIMDKPYNPRIFTAPAINLIFTNSIP